VSESKIPIVCKFSSLFWSAADDEHPAAASIITSTTIMNFFKTKPPHYCKNKDVVLVRTFVLSEVSGELLAWNKMWEYFEN
jgi:hypothetical protein